MLILGQLLLYKNVFVGSHEKHLSEALLMSTHNMFFMENLRKSSQNYHQILDLNKPFC